MSVSASLPGLTHTVSDAASAAGLMDVSMDAEQGLALLDETADRRGADRATEQIAGRDDRAQMLVEDGRGVEASGRVFGGHGHG